MAFSANSRSSGTHSRKRHCLLSAPFSDVPRPRPSEVALSTPSSSSPFVSLSPDIVLRITRAFFIFRISLLQPDPVARFGKVIPSDGTPVLQRPRVHVPDPRVFFGYFSRDPRRQIHLIFGSYWCKRFQDCWLLPFRRLRYLAFRKYYSGEELRYFRDALCLCSTSEQQPKKCVGVVGSVTGDERQRQIENGHESVKVPLVLALESLEGVAIRWRNRSPRWRRCAAGRSSPPPYTGRLTYTVSATPLTPSSVCVQRRTGKEKEYCWNWGMLRADMGGDSEQDESIRNQAGHTVRILATMCTRLVRLELEIGLLNMRVVRCLGWDEARTDGMQFGPWNEPMPPFFEVFFTPEFVEDLSSFPNLRSLTLRAQRPRPWSMLPRRDEDCGDLFDDDVLPSVVKRDEAAGGVGEGEKGGGCGVDLLQFLLQDPYLSLSGTRGAEFAVVGRHQGQQQEGEVPPPPPPPLELDLGNTEHHEAISLLSKKVFSSPTSSSSWRIPEPSPFLRLPSLRKLEVLDVPIHFISFHGHGHVQNLESLFLRGVCVSAFHLSGIVAHPHLEKIYLVNSVIRGDSGQLFFKRLKRLDLSLSIFSIDDGSTSIPPSRRKFDEGAAGIASISLRTLRRPLPSGFVHQLWRGLSRFPSFTPLPRVLDIAFTDCGAFFTEIFVNWDLYRPEEGRSATIIADFQRWRKVSSDDSIERGERRGYVTLA